MCWRLPFLAMLARAEAPGTLQMDGICVSDAARGQGVGTALLEAIAAKGQALNCERVALDVIDINPRARALYTRLGYQPGKVEKIGPLRHIFGFQSATRMELTLQTPDKPAKLT
jgi:ribosomal protein S18 acetylase RimI-like enzyme